MTKSPLYFFSKWLILILLLSVSIGLSSAVFLVSLNWITQINLQYDFLIYFLPIVGLIIGYSYYKWGSSIEKGNKLLIASIENIDSDKIPFRITPMIFLSTLVTHLFGGSAGREGTALQMAGGITEQISHWFGLSKLEGQSILIASIAAGFGAVFGTPLAGTIFALELNKKNALQWYHLVLCFLLAFGAHGVVLLLNVAHTHYLVSVFPEFSLKNILFISFSAVLFGCCARLFIYLSNIGSQLFSNIKISYLRPLVGGILVLLLVKVFDLKDFSGLGIPLISASFNTQAPYFFFICKILLTVLTLSSGFKGGEVTPLFFIGATLGSAMSLFIPLPVALLAALGFISVFAGASKTPIACAIMGVELFGFQGIVFYFIATFVSHFCAGKKGIYGE